MTIEKLHKILGLLIEAGLGEEPVCAEHDILYLTQEPGEEILSDALGVQLEQLGCHESDVGLAVFI